MFAWVIRFLRILYREDVDFGIILWGWVDINESEKISFQPRGTFLKKEEGAGEYCVHLKNSY